jgi:leucyl-tRNA synthetase
MEYTFTQIERRWQDHWNRAQVYKVNNDSNRPKYYVLDMFPYPSGAGLHVGHPLGYIASDIYARYKRLKGFNVLHPMGFDAFGLPAEQYAIENGIHPAISTEQNIENFKKQLDKIGLCFDWSREIRTSDPSYYKWTQWIFLQLFKSFYHRKSAKAAGIEQLTNAFQQEGNKSHPCPGDPSLHFSPEDWNLFNEERKQEILMHYRLVYCGYGEVNWCEALGTVLANDEVINGVSERGGFPVVKKKLRQWYLRITEYAERLLDGLRKVEFSEAMKEMQTNWIGKSQGAEIDFNLDLNSKADGNSTVLRVYTTRPDTIFGTDFMVIAPEHDLVDQITPVNQKAAVDAYIAYVKSRNERERMAEKKITGCFTGAYALNPFDGRKIPVWIAEYVLAGYGTGAIMGVPCGDERDYRFAKHFNIPITNIIGQDYNGEQANPTKDAILENSGFLNGKVMHEAIGIVINKLEGLGIGIRKVNYKIRDAAFSRQRYWGEPIPIVWKEGIAYPLEEKDLPLELPHVENYRPGPEGEGPLSNVQSWTIRQLETNTMPGFAGSSWYFLRFMDPHNDQQFCSRAASDYWKQVDLYIGGTEHAVGHLLYSRMWTKVLCDLGFIDHDEPYKKLVNQGMIQGSSRFVYRVVHDQDYFISQNLINEFETIPLHVDVNLVNGIELNIGAFRKWRPEFAKSRLLLDNKEIVTEAQSDISGGKYICGTEVEKMSKSKFNTVNPDDLVAKFGADTFRMYEMFLGPVEQSKPWDTKGIEGVHRFLKKLWRLFHDDSKGKIWTEEKPNESEWKILHKTIKKVEEDTERFSFNTAVSACMIAVNDLNELKCHKKEILEPLLIILAPYAPHVCEELYHQINNSLDDLDRREDFIINASYPIAEAKYLNESSKNYPIAINGKTRAELNIALDASQEDVEALVLTNDSIMKWLEGKTVKKLIYVRGKMINIVVS